MWPQYLANTVYLLLDDTPFIKNPSTNRPFCTTLNSYPGLRDLHPRAPLYNFTSTFATKFYSNAPKGFWQRPTCKFVYYAAIHPFTTEPPFDYTDISQWSGKKAKKHGRIGITDEREVGMILAQSMLDDMVEESWQKKHAGASGHMTPQIILILVHGDVSYRVLYRDWCDYDRLINGLSRWELGQK